MTEEKMNNVDTSKLGGRMAWYALILISLTQAMSMVDRQVLSILAPRIKVDLGVGDAEIGLLYGTVFALFYALFSLPLGRLADGWTRNRLLSLSILGWSIMTGIAGFAYNFGVLALSRLGVGIGEASVQPAGLSLLSDVFPKERRGMLTAVIAAAIATGLGGAIMLGGVVADTWDAAYSGGSAPLGLSGWQAAFIAAALPGIVLSFMLWRLPEPIRGAADGIVQPSDPKPFIASWNTLAAIIPGFAWLNFLRRKAPLRTWIINIGLLILIIAAALFLIRWTDGLRASNPIALTIGSVNFTGNTLQWLVSGFGAYVLVCWIQSLKLSDRATHAVIIKSPSVWFAIGIASLQLIINYGIMGWTPPYIIKKFNQTAAETGAIFGPLSAILGIVGPLIAGPVSDWAHKRITSGRLYITLFSLSISPLLALIVYTVDSLVMFYVTFCIYALILTMWMPPIYAAYLDLVLPRMRGTVMSFYILLTTITGLGLGPYTVGLISDVNGGNLGSAILYTNLVAPLIVVLIVLLIRCLKKDESLILSRARAAGEPV